jgi:hypothetical protein
MQKYDIKKYNSRLFHEIDFSPSSFPCFSGGFAGNPAPDNNGDARQSPFSRPGRILRLPGWAQIIFTGQYF